MKPLQDSEPAGTVSRKLVHFFVGVAIFAAVVQLFLPATYGGFVFDDYQYVVENVHVHGGLTWPAVKWAFRGTYASNWHPLTWISHMLDVEIYGAKPSGHHLTSVLLHSLNTVLLLIALSRLTGSFWRSAFVAAVFGLHPLRVESVAWVAERKDVLSTMFWMLAIIAYARYTRRPRASTYLLVLLLFILGLMSKPMVVMLPATLILLDWWPLGRLQRVSSERGHGDEQAADRLVLGDESGSLANAHPVWEKVPFFVLAIVSAAVTMSAQASSGAVAGAASLPFRMRAANAVIAYLAYIRKMIWPTDLAVYYTHPVGGIPTWQAIFSGAILAAITLQVSKARSRPYLLFGWLWYLVTLLPVIGLVQVGKQSMADRYTYVSLIGLSVIAAWGIPEIVGRVVISYRPRIALLTAAWVVVVAACAARTSAQISYWRDERTLFSHALAVTKDNWLAHHGLARALDRQGDTEAAVAHYRRSIAIDPTNADVHNGLGTALLKLGRTREAIKYLREAVRLDPKNASARLHYGVALQGVRPVESLRQFREAVRLQPDNPLAHKNLAAALARKRDFVGAVRHYEIASRLMRDSDPGCLIDLAEAYYRSGRKAKAASAAERALKLARESGMAPQEYIRARLNIYRRH